MKNFPLVSVIIVSHNGIDFVEVCLDSVFKSAYPNKEIIFVDNASTDGSKELVKKKYSGRKNFKIIENSGSFGPAAGRNIGAAAAKGKYLAFLDNDTKVSRFWLNELIKVLEKDKTIGSAQSKLLRMMPGRYYDCAGDYLGPLGFLIERSQRVKDEGQWDYIAEIFSAKSAASIIKTKIFNKIGGFDEKHYMYLEETDLSWRVWLAGYRVVFIPKSVVYHAFNTPKKDFKRYYEKNFVRYHGARNYIFTLIKNLEFKNLVKILPLHLGCWFVLAFSFILKGNFTDGFNILKGIGWNLLNLKLLINRRCWINTEIRKVSDKEIFNKVMKRRELSFYLERGLTYLRIKSFWS